jgi:dCMP deaminase
MKKILRPDIDEYFLKIASVVAERSTCQRHHIGAVAVGDRRILATGYNGAPTGLKDCLELGCLRNEMGIPSGERHEICRAVHAEQNVIIQAALHGISIKGSTIYCTHTPCFLCAKMLVNAQIKRFVTFKNYDISSYNSSIVFRAYKEGDLFKEAGIDVDIKERPLSKITYLD